MASSLNESNAEISVQIITQSPQYIEVVICYLMIAIIFAISKKFQVFCFYRMQVLRKVLFLAPSVCFFLFMYEISLKPLNRFMPNSHERRVWSLTRTSLKVKIKGQGHQGQKKHFSALLAVCVVMFDGTFSL